jgi:tetratricopeptide (TPR) repeat protein
MPDRERTLDVISRTAAMPKFRLFIALTAACACAACAQHPTQVRSGAASGSLSAGPTVSADLALQLAQASEDEDSLEERARRILRNSPPPSTLPDRSLDQELLFKFLLSEIAGQRGNAQLAAQGYLDMAKSTRDPRIARRAVEVATYSRQIGPALEAARIWYEVDKDNPQARQALVSLLISSNKLSEAKPLLTALLQAEGDVGQGFLQLQAMLSRHQDKNAVFTVMKDLTKGYPQLPEAHLALAQAALAAGKLDVAGAEGREALRLRPDWEMGALFQAQLIQQRDSAQKAAEYLQGYLQTYPNAREVRASYARLLISAKQIKEARAQYLLLLEEQPASADINVTAGLLSLQLNDFDAAETYLLRGLELNYRDPNTLRFYIGQSYEERKRYPEAMKWYRSVESGDQFVAAQARYAFMLGKQNKVAEARTYLQQVQVESEEQRATLIQAEAQLLREAKAYQESYDVLAKALERQPENTDLLYDTALAAEKLDRLDVLETNLRKVIAIKPDHAQAYNALGYTLADRTTRLVEAREYIEKALKLSPEDPFILDSMGWVLYRQGQHKEGLEYLQRAFAQRPDPEIAAHVGEVLWVKGRQQEAEKVWRDSLGEHPDNDVLQGTMKRFIP